MSTTAYQDLDEDSDASDDTVVPTTKFLTTCKHIEEAVDLRLQELAKINKKGKFNSQRGNNDQVTVKKQISWPRKLCISWHIQSENYL